MVKSNLSAYSLVSGGSTPLWKLLGYSSAQAYLNAMSKNSSNATPSLLANYANIANTTKAPSPGISTVDTSAIRNALDSSKVKLVSNVGSTGSGGVTDEGVIIGNTGNLIQLPQIKTGSSGSTANVTATSDLLKKYATLANAQISTPTTTTDTTTTATTTPTTTTEARTDEGSYNGTSDFLEAFKENYGYDYDGSALTRREGMSDGTWNALQLLYKYYKQGLADEEKRNSELQSENEYYNSRESELAGAYDASRETLGKNKSKSQQNASISLDKLLKYLPAQARAQGYEGLGTSESSALKAYANYNNNMGEIASDYNSQMTSLDQSEISDKNDLAKERKDTLASINDKYDAYARARDEAAGTGAQEAWEAYETERKAKEEQLRQEASAKETEIYENYRDMLNYSTSTDYNSLAASIDELNVNDEYKQLLKDKAKIVAESNIKAEEEQTTSDQKSESEALYSEVANAVAVKIESAIGDDGKISQSDYQAIVDYVNGYKGKLDDGQIARLMASLEANQGYVRSEAEEEENATQKDYYTVKTSDVTFNYNGGWWIFGKTDYSSGDNFSVIDDSGFKYRIESGGEVADTDIAEAAAGVGNNQVFGYAGKIYIKIDGKIYLIQKRANSYGDHYDKLYAKFYG